MNNGLRRASGGYFFSLTKLKEGIVASEENFRKSGRALAEALRRMTYKLDLFRSSFAGLLKQIGERDRRIAELEKEVKWLKGLLTHKQREISGIRRNLRDSLYKILFSLFEGEKGAEIAAGDGIIILDEKGVIEYCSEEALRIVGLKDAKPADYKGKLYWGIFAFSDGDRKVFEYLMGHPHLRDGKIAVGVARKKKIHTYMQLYAIPEGFLVIISKRLTGFGTTIRGKVEKDVKEERDRKKKEWEERYQRKCEESKKRTEEALQRLKEEGKN